MKRDMILPQDKFKSSFLSCEKDLETILTKLFITSQPYSDELKKLIVINTKDCLDNTNSKVYKDIINNMSLSKMRKDGYIRLEPKLTRAEHEDVKTYILIGMDNFTVNYSNPEFRDCTVSFDILCHPDYWDIGDFRLRPLKIAGYIDGILNNSRLSGIGTFQFVGCNELVLDETLSGYTLMYRAVHHTDGDDKIPRNNSWL